MLPQPTLTKLKTAIPKEEVSLLFLLCHQITVCLVFELCAKVSEKLHRRTKTPHDLDWVEKVMAYSQKNTVMQ